MTGLVAVLGKGDRRAFLVTQAIDQLLAECLDRTSPHEFDVRTMIGADGAPREIKLFPDEWLRRLERAATGGAFERMQVWEIVDRILTTEPAP